MMNSILHGFHNGHFANAGDKAAVSQNQSSPLNLFIVNNLHQFTTTRPFGSLWFYITQHNTPLFHLLEKNRTKFEKVAIILHIFLNFSFQD